MSNWSKEEDEADKFLEFSHQELDKLNKEGAVKSELETSSTLLTQAQSTPVMSKLKATAIPGYSIPNLGCVPSPRRGQMSPPPSGSQDQKKAKPPQVF